MIWHALAAAVYLNLVAAPVDIQVMRVAVAFTNRPRVLMNTGRTPLEKLGRSPALLGKFDFEHALCSTLSGTGFVWSYEDGHVYVEPERPGGDSWADICIEREWLNEGPDIDLPRVDWR